MKVGGGGGGGGGGLDFLKMNGAHFEKYSQAKVVKRFQYDLLAREKECVMSSGRATSSGLRQQSETLARLE